MTTSERNFQQLIDVWRSDAQSDREKTYDMNARLQRGETVLLNSAPYGPYKDLREACADEASAIRERLVGLHGLVKLMRSSTHPTPEVREQLALAANLLAEALEQILGP